MGLKLKITNKLNKEASKYLAYGSILSGFVLKKLEQYLSFHLTL